MSGKEAMKVKINEIDEVTRKAAIVIPAGDVQEQYKTRLQQVSGQVKMRGFRPGKAPLEMIEKMHGSRIHIEVIDQLINKALN